MGDQGGCKEADGKPCSGTPIRVGSGGGGVGRLGSLLLGPEVGEKDQEIFPLLPVPTLTTLSPQTHLLSEMGGEESERRERGRRVGLGLGGEKGEPALEGLG